MEFRRTEIAEVIVVEPTVHRDARGFFLETYHAAKYAAGGIDALFVQDNHSQSGHGTLRGLHMQLEGHSQGKLVRVVEGEIFDVAADVRRGSPTFKRWVGVRLSAASCRQLWIPAGFLHGFYVLSATAQVEYKCTALYDRAGELTVAWNDPDLNIAWPATEPLLSAKDAAAPPLAQVMDRLPVYEGSGR